MTPERIRAFWEWVVENEDALHSLIVAAVGIDGEKEPDRMLTAFMIPANLVTRRIKTIHPNLSAVFNTRTLPAKLVISANNDTLLFPVVEEIVESAPPLKHFVVAGFQRRWDDTILELLEKCKELAPELAPSQNLFTYSLVSDSAVDITVYTPCAAHDRASWEKQVEWIRCLVCGILGESDLGNRIRRLEIKPLVEVAKDDQVQPLTNLRSLIDQLFPKN